MSLRNVSDLKQPPSGSTTDTFQQQGQHNDLPDVKFSLVSCVQYITRQLPDFPKDGPLRAETSRSLTVLINWCQ